MRRVQEEVEEVPLHLDACHSCAMREVGIDDNGSEFSEVYLAKRRRAYHDQHAWRIPPQRAFRYGLNELGGEECSLCGPDGVYKGSAPDPDTEHAESEEEEQEEEDNELARRSIVERLFKNVSWDTIGEDARANLYYYALDHGLLAETLEEQERQGTASGQDAPLHGLQPGRMSHGSSDEELVCDHCRREIREDQDSHWCPVQRCRYILHRNCVRPHMQEHHHSSPIPPEFASPFPMKLKPMRGAVVDGETQTVIGGRPELSDVATQTVIGLIPTPQLFNIDARDAPKYISRREAELFRKRRRVEAT